MGSITGTRVSLNILSRNYKIMSALRPMNNCLCRFSLSKEIYYPKSQQRFLHAFRYCDIPNCSPYIYIRIDNARYFSVTCILAKTKDRGKDKKKQKPQNIDFNEMEQIIDVNKLITQFEKTIDGLKNDFVKYLSVRSSIGAIEELSVKFEGKDYTLQELAQISRKPKLIVLSVSTFPQAIPDILKSLMKNQMKLNPQQDGTTIYVPVPK